MIPTRKTGPKNDNAILLYPTGTFIYQILAEEMQGKMVYWWHESKESLSSDFLSSSWNTLFNNVVRFRTRSIWSNCRHSRYIQASHPQCQHGAVIGLQLSYLLFLPSIIALPKTYRWISDGVLSVRINKHIILVTLYKPIFQVGQFSGFQRIQRIVSKIATL